MCIVAVGVSLESSLSMGYDMRAGHTSRLTRNLAMAETHPPKYARMYPAGAKIALSTARMYESGIHAMRSGNAKVAVIQDK